MQMQNENENAKNPKMTTNNILAFVVALSLTICVSYIGGVEESFYLSVPRGPFSLKSSMVAMIRRQIKVTLLFSSR